MGKMDGGGYHTEDHRNGQGDVEDVSTSEPVEVESRSEGVLS